jgi:hypothetical protein
MLPIAKQRITAILEAWLLALPLVNVAHGLQAYNPSSSKRV